VFTLVRNGDIESIQSALKGSLFHKLLISLILMIIQNTFTLIPLILLITINITLFGFFYGFIWSWFTSIIAAVIVFIGVRYYFQDRLLEKIDANLMEKVEENGFLYVFAARMFPFVPTSIINIVTGLSSIQFKQFILGTVIGNFIYLFVLSFIPLGLLSKNTEKYVLGIIIVLSVISFYLYKKLNNRTKRNKLINLNVNEQQGHKGGDGNF
jgi:uncharacterized membrane protein YdjX (TVP38/TMEM64 family)